MSTSSDGDRFETLYQANQDPWSFASSKYELYRYDQLLQRLSKDRYSAAFEIGCSVGVFTAMLAPRCDGLLAIDVAPSAIMQARHRCSDFPQVQLHADDVRTMRPQGPFDLILLNEIGYYFDLVTLAALAGQLSGSLRAGGEFVASHWLGHSTDHALHGDDVHDLLQRVLPLRHISSARHCHFRIDAWTQSSSER